MGKPSIKQQLFTQLISLFEEGRSKHKDKRMNGGLPRRDKIYSYSTFRTYFGICLAFLRWTKKDFGIHDIESALPYAGAYLQLRINSGICSSTIHKDACAIGKLYGRSSTSFGVALPPRKREDFHKNDYPKEYIPSSSLFTCASRQQHKQSKRRSNRYSVTAEEIYACSRSCGLRKKELLWLRPKDVTEKNGHVYVFVRRGKGGRKRTVRALNRIPLILAQRAAAYGREHVFTTIPIGIPIHALRHQYAQEVYASYMRPIYSLKREQLYRCRKDMAGIVLDRYAMYMTSLALGHSRLSVVTYYLR